MRQCYNSVLTFLKLKTLKNCPLFQTSALPPQYDIKHCWTISKASAYRYKKERSVAFESKYAPDPAGGAHDAPQTP